MTEPTSKITWSGVLTGVQPRIRLTRSFDQRTHTYLGYVLRVRGRVGAEEREFLVAVGEAAQAKHAFRVGDRVGGEAVGVAGPRTEVAEFYKASKVRVLERGAGAPEDAPGVAAPPWLGVPVALEVYRRRGHRRLDARTYDTRCVACVWGCRMAVEMIIDQWKGGPVRYRQEAFCYGPLACATYRAGAPRVVPGRKGMSWTEEDWVDEDAVRHRTPDE